MATIETDAAAATAVAGPGAGFFYIQRMVGGHYVLDVNKKSSLPGSRVIIYPKNSQTNQQWQFVSAGASNPGWWYLQSRISPANVMTVIPNSTQPPPIVMMPKGAGDANCQLWCLVPTEVLGYWYIQSQRIVSNRENPLVMGVSGDGSEASAVAVTLDFLAFEAQAWGFSPA